MKPRFPLYIPSKGRFDVRLTSDSLNSMGVFHYLVIEEQEFKKYSRYVDKKQLLVLDKKYQQDYETFDGLGDSKSKGPGSARNFAWDHSILNGFDWHWVMDDNIRGFERLHKNKKIKVSDGAVFRAMEDFVLRYENVGMAGPNYNFFAKGKQKLPPFITNTRIYSCNFIRNDLKFRWRGRYNEDTDLSLRMLKSGWCTVQFNAFLQCKAATQTIKGGNTGEFYAKEGTAAKSKMQVAMHPDVSRLTFKFGRWHHEVDYRKFKKIKLVRKPNFKPTGKPNNFGMELVSYA